MSKALMSVDMSGHFPKAVIMPEINHHSAVKSRYQSKNGLIVNIYRRDVLTIRQNYPIAPSELANITIYFKDV